MKKSTFCHNTALFAWKFQICFSIYFFTLDPLWWFRFFFQTTLILDFIEENIALSCKNGTFFPSFSSLNISNKLTFGILCPSSELHFTHSREREKRRTPVIVVCPVEISLELWQEGAKIFLKALGPLDPLTAIANSHTMHHRAENSFEISSNYFGWGQFYLIWLTECTYCDACWLIFHSSAVLGYCRLFLLCVAQCEEILKNVQLLYYLLFQGEECRYLIHIIFGLIVRKDGKYSFRL